MSEQAVQEVALRVALERAIARQSDDYDRRARQYADRLTGTKLEKTQVRGLETLASTTDKVSDITDWLKLRVGRDAGRDRWAKEGIGRDLVTELEGLRRDAKEVVDKLRVGEGRVGEGRVGEGRVGEGRVGEGRVGEGRVGEGRVGEGRVGEGSAFTYPMDPDLERQVHLRLCREFLKHLAAHFEYLKAERER